MELNQLLCLQGEVAKIFRMPQGHDSGLNFYTSNGRRLCLFDTSATTHADAEPCSIVEPHPPGARLVPSGLPVFTLSYQNDDGERRLGRDSKLTFTAPAGRSYLARVSDVRGRGGERFAYRLKVRPARPDFQISLQGANPTVNAVELDLHSGRSGRRLSSRDSSAAYAMAASMCSGRSVG